jgi:hypothetical protein
MDLTYEVVQTVTTGRLLSFQLDWTLFGKSLRVAAVDLSSEWQEIEQVIEHYRPLFISE